VSPVSTVNENNPWLSLLLIVTIIALLFFVIRKALLLVKRKKKNPEKVQADSDTSATNLKQQLFVLLEKAGINSPGGLTRMELKNALQEIGLPDDIQSAIPAVLDSLDRILYSPSGAIEARTPDAITEKVNTLLPALRAKAGS